MPTRMLHDSLFDSPSLLRCTPRAQDAFPRIILVADSFGCFVADPDKVKGQAWNKRPDVTPLDIAGWFREWSRAEMLFLWVQGGRTYGYLTGWFGDHGQRWWPEYRGKKKGGTGRDLKGSGRKTPRPPGWLGLRESPWNKPSDWTPGDVWRGLAEEALPGEQHTETLSLFLPARESGPAFPRVPADPDPDPVSRAAPRARARAAPPSGAVPGASPRAVEGPPDAVPEEGRGAVPGLPGAVQAGVVPATHSDAVPSERPGAVPGPDAVPDVTYLRRPAELERPPPRAAPLAGQFWPRTEQLRRALSDRLGGQQDAGRGLRALSGPKEVLDAFEQTVATVGVEAAFSACVNRALEQGKGASIRNLSYFVGVVQDLARPATGRVNRAATTSAGIAPDDRTKFRRGERAL